MSDGAIIQVIIPGWYLGLSCSRKTVPPMMPPMPPKPTRVAEQRARFHWPRMLLACHVRTQGTFALQAVTARKTPKYRTATLWVQPRREIPAVVSKGYDADAQDNLPSKQRNPLKMMNGDRMCHLSPNQANPNMTMAART